MTLEPRINRLHVLRGPLLALLALAALFLAIRWFQAARARSFATRNACISNLRILDGVKVQAGIELGLPNGETPTAAQVSQFIPGGLPTLKCRAGGVYAINPLNLQPSCSIPGHELR